MSLVLKHTKQLFAEGPIGIYLMAILIPINPKWLGMTVALIILEQIIRRSPIKKKIILSQLSWKNPGVWLFLFYMMHVVGLLWTENLGFAYMDLGMKSTLAIFPLFFFLYSPVVNWKMFVQCFVFGAFVSILINIILSTRTYLEINHSSAFIGEQLSHLMHRGYWSVYLSIAYFFLLRLVFERPKVRGIFLNLFGAIILALFIVLSESKESLIALLLISAWAVIKLILQLKHKWILPIIIALFVGGIFVAYTSVPSLEKRVNSTFTVLSRPVESYDKTSTESTKARIFLWTSAIELIKENFWKGVGTGDIKDELIQKNYDNGYTGVAEAEFNCHNQFFNSFVAIGFFGFLFLLLSIITNFIKRKSDPLYFWRVGIALLLFLAMLPESMLETQAGIIPYAFLLSFLTAFELQKGQENHISQY